MEELLNIWKERNNLGLGSRKDLIDALKKNQKANGCQILVQSLEQPEGKFGNSIFIFTKPCL